MKNIQKPASFLAPEVWLKIVGGESGDCRVGCYNWQLLYQTYTTFISLSFYTTRVAFPPTPRDPISLKKKFVLLFIIIINFINLIHH